MSLLLLLLLLLLATTFLQGVSIYIRKTNHFSSAHNVTAILLFQIPLHVNLFAMIKPVVLLRIS